MPAATPISNFGITGPLDFAPSVAALQGSSYALYELLANAVKSF